jgi:transcriptional regulator with XRE-family HTH domain
MIYWLAQAAKQERLKKGRKQVHIAAAIDRDQSTINRFEQGEHWPRDPDEILAGYADDLEIDPRQLWAEAIKLWADSATNNQGRSK